MPEIGDTLAREEIAALYGGSARDYLPHVQGRVVCACVIPRLNPAAPFVILPGLSTEVRRWGEVLSHQDGAIPVFVQRAVLAWEYMGKFEVERVSLDADEIAQHAANAGRLGDEGVSRVIFMRQLNEAPVPA